MPKPTLIALDTETGGFDCRINPILSIAIVIADENYNTLDGFEVKVAPPRGTVLEVPIPSHFLPRDDYTKRKIEYYLERPQERDAIARQGYAYVRQHATITARMESLLSYLKEIA